VTESGLLEIALIGAGQLGSRHLQALALFDRPARVTVIDPSAASLAVARERFDQVAGGGSRVEARYATDFAELPARIDAAVVATNADARRAAIEKLLARSSVRVALLEKVLFQRLADYEAVGALLARGGTRAWVNCAQRLWPFFRDLRPRTVGRSKLQISVAGAQWGLGCNAIHILDLLPFLTGDAGCRLETALDPGSIPSKRAGFVEFTGTLHAYGERGNRIVQTSSREGSVPISYEVQSDEFRAQWHASDGTMRIAEAAGGWQWRESQAQAPFQSQLTHTVLAEMLDTGRSALPGYDESAALHLPMLRAFLGHLGLGDADACPIT